MPSGRCGRSRPWREAGAVGLKKRLLALVQANVDGGWTLVAENSE